MFKYVASVTVIEDYRKWEEESCTTGGNYAEFQYFDIMVSKSEIRLLPTFSSSCIIGHTDDLDGSCGHEVIHDVTFSDSEHKLQTSGGPIKTSVKQMGVLSSLAQLLNLQKIHYDNDGSVKRSRAVSMELHAKVTNAMCKLRGERMEVEFLIGSNLEDCAKRSISIANVIEDEMMFEFNGHELVVSPDSTVEGIIKEYEDLCAKAREKYLQSDEYKEYIKRRDQEMAEGKILLDKLMAVLPEVKTRPRVLSWLRALHRNYSACNQANYELLASHLLKLGFKPNANTGEDFKKDSGVNHADYIIGQYLNSFKNGTMAPGIGLTFIDSYEAQFYPKKGLPKIKLL